MIVFENLTTMRRLRSPSDKFFNSYNVHCQVEKLLVEGAQINTPFAYTFVLNNASHSASTLIRTVEATNLPGERRRKVSFKCGQQISFVVALHTSKSVNAKGERTRSVAITDPDEQVKKLEAISTKNGFKVLDAQVIDNHSLFIKKGRQPGFWLAGAKLMVQAEIIDPVLFEVAFAEGIGSKKSFGFGLILPLNQETADE